MLDRRKDRFVEDQDTRVSVGIDFPFGRVPNGDGYFKTTKRTIDSIKNNIKLLLQTNNHLQFFKLQILKFVQFHFQPFHLLQPLYFSKFLNHPYQHL